MAQYRIFGIARDEDNNPVVGATASLRRESDNVEVTASTTTGADGSYGWLEEDVLYPGPIKVRITALDGVVREISGRTTGQSGTIFVGDLHRAFRMMTDGVVDGVDGELAVSGSGVTLEVTVATGFAYLYGHPSYWADPTTVTIATNGTANPRKDLIVVRLYPPGTANEGEQEITVVQGTPAASPVAPGVTQDPNVVWEIALAEVTVAAGATAITGGNVADVRTYTSGPLMDSSVTTAKLANLAVTGAKIADETVTAAKLTAGVDVSTAEIAKVLKAPLVATDPPSYTQLALGELSNVSATGPTSGQVLAWDATDSLWEPTTINQVSIVVQEGDVTTVAQATTFDFDASDFNVTESPTGEANIALAYGTTAGTPAEGNHTHTSFTNAVAVQVDSDTAFQVKGAAGEVVLNIDTNGSETIGFWDTSVRGYSDAGVTQTFFLSTATGQISTEGDLGAGGTITQNGVAVSTVDHTHAQNPSLMNNANKAYGYTAVSSTTGASVASCDITLLSGVEYDIHATGFGVLNAPSGQSITLGVKIGAGSTNWGTEVQVAGGDKAAFASSFRTVTGPSTQTVALYCKVSSGTGSITTGHVTVMAVPRNVPAS